MTDCKKCLFYSLEEDEQRRSGEDVVVIGQEPKDNHFCFAYTPIPPGYYAGQKDCPQFMSKGG